jgi:hypothetical protein
MYVKKEKMTSKTRIWAAAWVIAIAAAAPVSAALDFISIPCYLINQIFDVVDVVAPSLVAIMFAYGAAKYAYSADNPGGRNQGRTICVHALIGGIIFIMWFTVQKLLFSGWTLCWT